MLDLLAVLQRIFSYFWQMFIDQGNLMRGTEIDEFHGENYAHIMNIKALNNTSNIYKLNGKVLKFERQTFKKMFCIAWSSSVETQIND